MKLNQFYSHIKIIILLLYLVTLNAKVYIPIEDEENIKLTIGGKEWTYYELDDGLIYDNIGIQYDIGDSIQVGIYSRTIMASAEKKNKKYGFIVQINDNEPKKLKYKNLNEGDLTKKFSYLVQRDFLYKIALELKLNIFLNYNIHNTAI